MIETMAVTVAKRVILESVAKREKRVIKGIRAKRATREIRATRVKRATRVTPETPDLEVIREI